MLKCLLNLGLLLVLFSETRADEILLGVSPRNSQDGPGELARWEGWRGPVPEDWVGRKADLIGLSLGGARNWGSLAEYGVNFLEENCGWQGFERKSRMEIAVPMWPEGWRGGKMNWETAVREQIIDPEVAALENWDARKRFEEGGRDYLSYFWELATNLVRKGYGGCVIRLGWEYNGDWFPWGHGNFEEFKIGAESYDHARAYREVFAAIHRTMMSVEGAQFRWSWCAAIGAMGFVDQEGNPIDYSRWFPGEKVVDFVSVDYFDDQVRYYPGRQEPVEETILEKLTWLNHLLQIEGLEASLSNVLEALGADMEGSFPWAAKNIPQEKLAILKEREWTGIDEFRAFLIEKELVFKGRPGAQWFRDFAAEKKLGFLVSEWGVWENDPYEKPQLHYTGGDNPEYVRLFADWLRKARIPGQQVGALYFEEFNDLSKPGPRDGFSHALLKGERFPKARAAVVKHFHQADW